jgi:hypothetical protein
MPGTAMARAFQELAAPDTAKAAGGTAAEGQTKAMAGMAGRRL